MHGKTFLIFILVLLIGGAWITWEFMSSDPGEKRLGFITSVTTNGNYGIIFDKAEWLSGKEGEDAAIAAGLCREETRYTCLPNDYIIRNATVESEAHEFATDVMITMQTFNMEQEGVHDTVISRQEFEKLLNDSRAQWRQLPFEITIRSGLVREVKEIYVP
ncbi:MAG: hypothetical protein WA021_02305 [Minisyncoccia bacterium]